MIFSEGGGNNAWVRNSKALEPEQQPLTGIVDELKTLRNLQQQYEADQLYGGQPGQIDSYEQQQPARKFEFRNLLAFFLSNSP